MSATGKDRITFYDIREKEQSVIKDGRGETDSPPKELIGLAFSGGGIRSATFNLGVLQALSATRLLKRFDYLSTVSGGGYIGSWFSALLQRKAAARQPDHAPSPEDIAQALAELQKELAPDEQDKHSRLNIHARTTPAEQPTGQKAVLWLRRYSAYLTPRYGLFSLDTLAALAGLFRNLLLNQAILICVLMTLLLAPYLMMEAGHALSNDASPWLFRGLAALSGLLIGLAVYNIGWSLQNDYTKSGDITATALSKLSSALIEGEVWTVVISAFLGTSLAALLFYLDQQVVKVDLFKFSLLYGTIYLLAFALTQTRQLKSVICTLLTASALSGMCYGYGYLLDQISEEFRGAYTLIVGPVLLIQLLCMAAILQTGLTSRGFSEINREWLGRAGGIVFALELMWVAFTALALLGPALVDYMNDWVAYSGGVAWLLGTATTFWLARSDQSGGNKTSPKVKMLLSVAPYLIMLGLLIVLSYSLHNALYKLSIPTVPNVTATSNSDQSDSDTTTISIEYGILDTALAATPATRQNGINVTFKNDSFEKSKNEKIEDKPTLKHSAQQILQENAQIKFYILFLASAIFLIVGGMLSWRVDINLFSMHQFYRNRLARGYLGASNPKRADRDPFTDFAQSDDMALSALKVQRPIHLINTTLNLTKVKEAELAWQERLGVAFLFSPHYCGYQLSPQHQYYVATDLYMNENCAKGVMLGTAVAVSGAAASPNMGYHSSPPLAFLMTFFNVRLGRWCPNTARKDIGGSSPRFGFWCLLKELFGSADDQYRFVNLTDGGHFENLGIYELVRRQCKVIVVSDGGADDMNGFTYEDLGNAIQKCRVDFGATIEMFGMDKMRPRDAQARYACGRIHYADGDTGVLIYLKPMLRGNEPVDVSHYAALHRDFPHQSTGDQWFEESQFESYRQLGILTAQEMLDRYALTTIDAKIDDDPQCDNKCDTYAQALYQHMDEHFLVRKA